MELKGYMGSVSFDGQTVRLSKKARGEQMIPLDGIAAVQIEKAGIGMRAIRFAVAGGTLAGRASVTGSHKDAAQDPFSLTFRANRAQEFSDFAAAVLAAKTNA